jgi:hypothetical protein
LLSSGCLDLIGSHFWWNDASPVLSEARVLGSAPTVPASWSSEKEITCGPALRLSGRGFAPTYRASRPKPPKEIVAGTSLPPLNSGNRADAVLG